MGSPTGSVDGGAQSASPSAAVTAPAATLPPAQTPRVFPVLLAVSFSAAQWSTASRRYGPSRTR